MFTLWISVAILWASSDFKAVPIIGLAPAVLNDDFLASDGLLSLILADGCQFDWSIDLDRRPVVVWRLMRMKNVSFEVFEFYVYFVETFLLLNLIDDLKNKKNKLNKTKIIKRI